MTNDYFVGETAGIITNIIKEYIKLHPNELRRIDLLTEWVRLHGTVDVRRSFLKSILKGYRRMNSKLKRELENLGIEVMETKTHYKLRYFCNSRYQCVMSKTGSDKKAGDNLAAKIGKTFF